MTKIETMVTELGKVKPSVGIGLAPGNQYIWHACIDCGEQRWVRLRRGKAINQYCFHCGMYHRQPRFGKHSANWKGGRFQDVSGYVFVISTPRSFFSPMANAGNYILEHRLVMAKHLSRCLLPWEVVHHKNGTRNDNRLENLELLPDGRFHLVDLHIKRYIKKLEKENGILRSEVEVLRCQKLS